MLRHCNLYGLLACFAVIVDVCFARSIQATEFELGTVHVAAFGFITIVCSVILIVGCAEICRRQSGFKDFENEESFTPTDVIPPGPADFSLYPPVESTPDMGSAVIFEPLPDLASTMRSKVSNSSVLRPKVSVVRGPRDRLGSEDSLEDAIQQDSMQDKIRLQHLIANLRNQLPRSQLQYIKELGTGYFGKVLQGEGQKILPGHKKTKVVIQMLKEEADAGEQLTFLEEAMPFRETEHANVMKVLGQCVEIMPYLVVLELCPFGDLKTYLRSHKVAVASFNEKGLILKFASDMAAGLQALHQGNFVHRDFAIRNCLLSSDLTVKIGDYGLSEEMFKEDYFFDANGDPVPIRWLSPESVGFLPDGSPAIRRMTKESNIWSFGVALWECMQFGGLPYSELNNASVLQQVIKDSNVKLARPELPLTHVDRLYQLIMMCQTEPSSRPSLRELRIMLLHLLSSKTDHDSTAFDKKWEQLMPRKPPQVVKVSDANTSSIQTIADSNIVNLQQPVQRPTDLESGFAELNVSSLNHTSGNYGDSSKAKKAQTPNNELSLEAELSAAFASGPRDENNLSLDEEILAASTPKSDADKSFSQITEEEPLVTDDEAEERKRDVNLNESSESFNKSSMPLVQSSEPQKIQSPTIILEDESIPESPIPDIVAISLIKDSDPVPDFVTSTPKQDEGDKIGLTDSSHYLTLSDASSQYQTAMESNKTADDSDDFSFLGEKKFAALLQTVAAPSFEGDDSEMMSSSLGSSADKSIEEVFERDEYSTQTPTPTSSPVPGDDSSGNKFAADVGDSVLTLHPNDSHTVPTVQVTDNNTENV